MPVGYEKIGSGPHPVMALHGWFGDHTTFAPMRDALTQDEFTYICLDYRGYGHSKGMKGAYTVQEIAADAIELADALGHGSFSVIGHSMGGKAMQCVLAVAPRRVRKLVGIAPVPAVAVPFEAEQWKMFEDAVDDIGLRQAIIDFSCGPGRHSKAWTSHMARYSAETSTKEAFAGYLQSWAKSEFVAAIQGNTTPVKVIAGENDLSLSADVMKATFGTFYSNCEIEVMANAGHYPIDETPVALATSIEAFLRK